MNPELNFMFFFITNLLILKQRNTYRLERILTMVYVVQNYLASFGLYPSSGM
jgi:hypothetical protein